MVTLYKEHYHRRSVQPSLKSCEEGNAQTTLLSALWEWMIGEDKATALAENVTQTSLTLSTASTRRLAQNWQEVENKKNKKPTPHSQPPKQ